ncbi:Anp1-domain-containing protein [Halteromyces radiatus]|uniref:Anp1-domain-containing protein n=1 Tax=Halteromyces radiatus TaxID=101107 RepID=UPI00221FE74B|nr:Anp1-domain-containing protein [Halteromyces radiatus]KAI8085084.1 Anp1-domain-containing protein [Halteromyces radiatus]
MCTGDDIIQPTIFHSTNSSDGMIVDMVKQLSSPSPQSQQQLQKVTFQNLNDNDNKGEQTVVVMVVLPPWAIGSSLQVFFKQLAQQTHPHTRLALLLLNPPSPTTLYTVRYYLTSSRIHMPVDVYTKTYDSMTPWIAQDNHHDSSRNAIYELEPLRKSAMARAKNFLLQSALDPLDNYVLWLDPLLDQFPTTLITDFIDLCEQDNSKSDHGVDILVPNTMIRKDGQEWGYDRSNWQETTMSRSLQDTVPNDFVFMEGWWEYDTHRFLMVDMLTNGPEDQKKMDFTKVPLDGVGSTCLFVKAEVHRSGLNFPAYPYQHQLDSEAFAKAAQVEGYIIRGLPNYKIYHSNDDDDTSVTDDNDDEI